MALHLQAAPSPASASQRLADQIHLLSSLAETITYRILDLEERLAALEAAASAGEAAPDDEAVDLRLLETESRLEQLEQLLQPGMASEQSSRRLEPVAAVPGLAGPVGDEVSAEALFPEEGEQAFMDDIVA
ncbi:MAG: hypothetical protein VKI83_03045 [Synechococcaceae cyanobacterium]|nr:hypothetical protein [Synechococcaceae cyanobacterium]